MDLNFAALKGRRATLGLATLLGATLVAGALLLGGCSSGEQYPTKPITFVVPYAPGGGSDILVRNLDKLAAGQKIIPQNFVIDNRAGASGITGKAVAHDAKPDGYTIVITDDSSSYADLMGQSPFGYNDFTFIANMVRDYNLVAVRTESPYKTFKDLVDDAKKRPGKINIGGTGTANTDMVQVARWTKAAGVQLNYMGFDSGGQELTNLLGGQVDVAMHNPSEVYEQMRAGKVRALAITAPERIAFNDPMFKDIPTLKENGVDITLAQWRGIAGPPKMQKAQVDWLIAAFKKVTDSPQWKTDYLDKFQQMNAFVTGDDFKKMVDDEYASFKPVFTELGLLKK